MNSSLLLVENTSSISVTNAVYGRKPPLLSSPPPLFSNKNSVYNRCPSPPSQNQKISSLNLSYNSRYNLSSNDQSFFQSSFLEHLKKFILHYPREEVIGMINSVLDLNQFFVFLLYSHIYLKFWLHLQASYWRKSISPFS
jgi:hypothetical protein